MKKLILGLIVFSLILTGCKLKISSFQHNGQTSTQKTPSTQYVSTEKISENDLRIGVIRTNMTKGEVLKAVGKKPSKITGSDLGPTYYYNDGTEIFFVEGRVYSIKVADSKHLTPRGLRVGDNQSRVEELYGEPNRIDNDVWIYNFDNEEYNTFFVKLNEGKVKYIKVSLVM